LPIKGASHEIARNILKGVATVNPNQPTIPEASTSDASRQVLTFCLGAETYGVDILSVQEIRGWAPVTRLPQAATHLLGVLNIRGSIVPVIDMRVRFGLEQAQFTPVTVIVVLSVMSSSGRREFGLVVDSVSDVVDIDAAKLQDPPSLGSKINAELVKGLATVADRMLILLDVNELIRCDMEQSESPILAGAA
jgi:purine-binding chemotaxis protein CheW